MFLLSSHCCFELNIVFLTLLKPIIVYRITQKAKIVQYLLYSFEFDMSGALVLAMMIVLENTSKIKLQQIQPYRKWFAL